MTNCCMHGPSLSCRSLDDCKRRCGLLEPRPSAGVSAGASRRHKTIMRLLDVAAISIFLGLPVLSAAAALAGGA